jgi:hypothetical protein
MSKLYEKVLDHRMQALQAVVAPGKGVQPEQLGFSPNHRGKVEVLHASC